MADGGNTFRFSGETRNLLQDHSDYFATLKAALQEVKLGLKGVGDDARSERSFHDDGSVELTFFFPLDDNGKAEDGRIYLKDRFVFNPIQQKLQRFERTFEYNGKGAAAIWTPLLKKLEGWTYFDGSQSQDKDKIKRFAYRVVRSYSRPLTPSILAALKDKKLLPYLLTMHEPAIAQNPAWRVKMGDPETHYNLIYKDDATLELVFSVAIDQDAIPGNGRIFVNDTFTLNATTLELQEVERKWSLSRDAKGIDGLEKAVQALNQSPAPNKKQAKEFLQGVLSSLLNPADAAENLTPRSTPKAVPAVALSGEPPSGLPADYQSAFARRAKARAVSETTFTAQQKEILEILKEVAAEQFQHHREKSRGWLSSWYTAESTLSPTQEERYLAAVIRKAVDSLKPGQDAWNALARLELQKSGEQEIRDRLLRDPFLQRVFLAASDPDPAFRARQLMIVAREDLLKDKGFGAAAAYLAQKLQNVSGVKDEAGKLLAFLNGGGGTGTKAEILLPAFARHVANPHVVGAMMVAGPLGVGAESVGLSVVGRLGLWRLGWFGELGAAGAGVFGEAAAFTAVRKSLESLTRDPNLVFQGTGSEIKSAALLFGAFRMAHGVGAEASLLMSRGKLGKVFGGEGLPAAQAVLGQTVVGRVRVPLSYTDIGAPLPQLTRTGQVLSFGLNHVGGIAALYGAAALGRLADWQPANDQKFGGHLFDAILTYCQALLGYNLANRASGGKLFETVAIGKLRLEAQRQKARDAKARRDARTSIPSQAQAVFHLTRGEGTMDVHVTEGLKRIWLGRSVNESQVIYPSAEEAQVNFGNDAETVSNQHAVLTKDQSGVFYLLDLKTPYGTYVNGERVTGPVILKPGDEVQLGDGPKFVFGVDGDFILPTKPKQPKVSIPDIVQIAMAPPEKAGAFPWEILFAGQAIPEHAKVLVASLDSADGNSSLKLSTKKIPEGQAFSEGQSMNPPWYIPSLEDGRAAAEIYVDERGRFFISKDYEGNDPKSRKEVWVQGEKVEHWSFIHDGDSIRVENQAYTFRVSKVPQVEDIQDPMKDPAALQAAVDALTQGQGSEAMPLDQRDTGEFSNPVSPGARSSRASRPPQTPVEPQPPPAPEASSNPNAEPPSQLRGPSRSSTRLRPLTHSDEAVAASAGAPRADPPSSPLPGNEAPTPSVAGTSRRQPKFDKDKTQPGVTGPVPEPAKTYPAEYLANMDEGEPPMILHIGPHAFRADREHTSYIFGSRPDLNAPKPWQTAVKVEDIPMANVHFEIFFSGDGKWYVKDRITEQGTYIDGGDGSFHRLGLNEVRLLEDGADFYLGDPKDPSAVKVSFDRHGFRRERMPTLSGDLGATPAADFPKELLSHLGDDQDAAILRAGSKVIRMDRVKTNYILGRNPSDLEAQSSEQSGAFVVTEFLVSERQARVFIDTQGRWWIADLVSDHGTYLNGKLLEVQTPARLTSGDVIGFGAPDGRPGSIQLEFEAPTYLTWEQAMMVDSPEGIPIGDGDVESEANVESEKPSPEPPAPEASPPAEPSRPVSSPPPAVPGPASGGEQPPAETTTAERDPMDWSDMLTDDAVPEGGPANADPASLVDESSLEGNSPPADAEPAPTRGDTTAVFSVISGFGSFSPDLRSSAILGQLDPFLVEKLKDLDGALAALDVFPRLEPGVRDAVASDNFLGFLESLPRGRRGKEPKPLPERLHQKIMQLSGDYWMAGKFPRPFTLENDSKRVKFSSIGPTDPPPNISISLNLNPGTEAESFEAVVKHLLTLDVPLETIWPVFDAPGESAYLGVTFHAEHVPEVYQAVLSLAEEYRPILGSQYLPFAHRLLDRYEMEVYGVGVMEYHLHGALDPLQFRRKVIKKAFLDYQKDFREGTLAFDRNKLRATIIRAYQEKGLDINYPGFRQDTAESIFASIIKHTAPQQVDEAILRDLSSKPSP